VGKFWLTSIWISFNCWVKSSKLIYASLNEDKRVLYEILNFFNYDSLMKFEENIKLGWNDVIGME
jgi:hypothetical protein